ncbi:hypothetical protein BKA58DRAFT_413432 [Alternaria rosae]|uniref:uncharacterized protein n=1 Tax=Alternaria rosae TaxID=1187941 RepID=UPI001E8E430E|nr:uncharacterized protein BKA58DRAFT_413432 [Alternaria rosae]KAH6865782.1 hypothetical protein BKA58DRAFT_413432 [Alternaria rosae]
MKSNRLIVGLDYGTTYTGVSFCETSDNGTGDEHIEVIHDWPSQHTKIGTKEKVPSEVTYQKQGLLWGALIPSNVQRHMWTKLQLDPVNKGELVKIVREVSTSTENTNKLPVEIIADFLSQIKAHLIKNLDQKYGKVLWRGLAITLVVTVPAVWTDVAKARTLEAVAKAGFNTPEFPQLKNIIMTTEPEAAAIYTTKILRGTTQNRKFAVGDGFIICDMGGGTVDLISYRVAGLNPTVIEEATTGTGDQCGGSFVDRAFFKWLERRLGTKDFVEIVGCRSEDVPHTSLSKKAARLLQDFTLEAKSGFSGTETNYLRLPAPLSAIEEDAARGICDGDIMITPEDMIEIFEMCVRRAYELLGEQLEQLRTNKKVKVKYVFMVGGFSESPYMYEKIKTFAASCNGLETFKPNYAWSAVVRGAAAKGLEGEKRNTIKTRKCRRFYGTSYSAEFLARKHKESDSYIDSYDGIKRVSNQMSWLLTTGQDLPTSKEIHAKGRFTADFWAREKRETELILFASDSPTAPARSDDKASHKFKAAKSPVGEPYHSLSYDVAISVQSSLQYSLLVNGKTYGSVTAKYD